MAEMIDMGFEGPEEGTVKCSECDVVFEVTWQRNAYTTGVEFCPFCGVEFDDQNDIEASWDAANLQRLRDLTEDTPD